MEILLETDEHPGCPPDSRGGLGSVTVVTSQKPRRQQSFPSSVPTLEDCLCVHCVCDAQGPCRWSLSMWFSEAVAGAGVQHSLQLENEVLGGKGGAGVGTTACAIRHMHPRDDKSNSQRLKLCLR